MTHATQASISLCAKGECWHLSNHKVAGKIKWDNKCENNLKICYHRFKLWENNVSCYICCIFLPSHIFSKTIYIYIFFLKIVELEDFNLFKVPKFVPGYRPVNWVNFQSFAKIFFKKHGDNFLVLKDEIRWNISITETILLNAFKCIVIWTWVI